MVYNTSEHEQLPLEPEELGLKKLNEEQLFAKVLDSGEDWTESERNMVVSAYEQARGWHKDDRHRSDPYTYHLLRNANRAIGYLHITDPEIITAIILHDSVEDHPDKIIRSANVVAILPADPLAKQQAALRLFESMFTPRVARIVDGMTNPPQPPGPKLTYEERIQRYVNHVEEAVEDIDVWIGKMVDWSDNGIGIVHSDFVIGSPKDIHFKYKYGKVLPVLEARFQRDDVQAMLDPSALVNVRHMFDLARLRLAA